MKKTMILGCTIALLSSFSVLADSQYPASDFQPQVIYQDKSVTSAPAAASNEQDPNYPAANFQPTVIYSDASAATSKTPAAPAADEFDPNYPAANFQPKVIYP